jgi:flagellar hook-basal body protein
MDVIGNNIANVNTSGFKAGRAVFEDLLSQTISGGQAPNGNTGGVNPKQIGLGGSLSSIDTIFETGTVTSTSKTTDLAIEGEGFFVVRGEGAEELYYTRAGDFSFDRSGKLVNPSGYSVQGWMADPGTSEIQPTTDVGDIVIGTEYQTVQANPTSWVTMNAVLNTNADASVLEYPTMLHTANGSDDLFSVFSTDGVKMDVEDNEAIIIKAHASGITSMGDVFNDADVNLDMEDSPNLLVYVNNTAYTFTYGEDFTTMGQLADAMENKLEEAAGNGATAVTGPVTSINGVFDDTEVQANAHNAIAETYTITVDPLDSTRFTVTGSVSGTLNSGVIGQTYYAQDPATGGTLFTISGDAWSGAWAGGDTFDITTTAAPGPEQFDVSIVNGEFNITREADNGTDVQVNSFSGSPYLAVVMQSLAGTYNEPATTRTSDEIYYEETVYAGRDFNTLSELATVIEQAIDGNVITASNFSVNYDEDQGKFVFQNLGDWQSASGTTSGITLSDFSVDKAYTGTEFENNITPTGSLTIEAVDPADDPGFNATLDYGYSEQFYRYAEGTDMIEDLYTSSGESLGLDDTAILQFTLSMGGEEVSGEGTLAVAGSTLDDLRAMMVGQMGYENSSESQVANHIADVGDNSGKLIVTGEDGEANEIDYLKFEVVGSGDYSNFYDYFDYQTTQTASGGVLTTSQTLYDAQGNAHSLKYEFTMVSGDQNTWNLKLSTLEDGTSVAFNETSGDTVQLHFNADGSFNYISSVNGERISDLTFNYDTGSGAGMISNISMDLGTASMYDGIYISSEKSSVSSTEQDGYTVGNLEEVVFSSDGSIIGYYTNGEVATLAQIALATFTNEQGLMRVGDTLFAETSNSGSATLGSAETGSRGEIISGALENSNVDLSNEFVTMITTQRGFQANSRVITTSDEMLQELLTLKR